MMGRQSLNRFVLFPYHRPALTKNERYILSIKVKGEILILPYLLHASQQHLLDQRRKLKIHRTTILCYYQKLL